MDILLEESLIFHVNKTLADLRNEVKFSEVNVDLSDNRYVAYKTTCGKTIYLSPRGSLRSYKFDGGPELTLDQMACSLFDHVDRIINIKENIQQSPEKFCFFPLTDGQELRYTISKYSKFLNQFFDPTKAYRVEYTFTSMMVWFRDDNDVKHVYMFDFNSFSFANVLRNYFGHRDINNGVFQTLYMGTGKKSLIPVAIGKDKDGFISCKDFLPLMNFYETSCFKYLIYQEKKERKLNREFLKKLQEIAVIKMSFLQGTTVKNELQKLQISEDDYSLLIEGKTSSIKDDKGNEWTRKKLFNWFSIEEELDGDFFNDNNLLRKIEYEDIPDGEEYI